MCCVHTFLSSSLDSMPKTSSNELIGTHEMIANMLGVRREGISEAASRLQHAGIIRYRRGRITVLDRSRLEAKITEYYQFSKKESGNVQAKSIQH
jgi:Mn-dependent DtxR family transcriptional regulator